MTRPAEKLWVRILLVLLCAALAAGGTLFASCFGYARIWRTGGSEDFAESEFATSYIEDCLDYLWRFGNWMGLPTESAARGYGRGSFGCVLLCDGETVFDTTTKDAVPAASEYMFYRYEEELVEGSREEYEQAAMNWEQIPGHDGYVAYVMPAENANADLYTKADNASAEPADDASGQASEETDTELLVVGFEHEYTLRGYLNYPIEPYSGLYAEYTFWQVMLALKDWALPLTILCWVLAAALIFARARDALRRKTQEDFLTRLPFDAFAVGVLLLTALLSAFLSALGEELLIHASGSSWLLELTLLPIPRRLIRVFLWTAAGIVILRSGLMRVWRGSESQLLFGRIPAAARVLFPLGLGLVFAVLGTGSWNRAVIAAGLALILLSGVFAALLFRQLRLLRKASERLAGGELDAPVGAERFWPGVREQAEALDRIGDGIKTAVDEQLRGERLKTELITNVSHDLKTPVTSIVSCAELLKRPDTTQEQAAEYVAMLDRQCRKLQKLTDDLLMASKASSGAIDVNREPTDVRELLNQSVGEFAGRLEQKQIETVVCLPEEPCILDTDGQLLWRILDNLIQNIVKYAQPGTRAYLDLISSPEETVISLKNVSATPLNISAETLMERFVRGDTSRSTEGSGLGLSIAQSLARLLGGELTLTVDGDLFKAEVRFAND